MHIVFYILMALFCLIEPALVEISMQVGLSDSPQPVRIALSLLLSLLCVLHGIYRTSPLSMKSPVHGRDDGFLQRHHH